MFGANTDDRSASAASSEGGETTEVSLPATINGLYYVECATCGHPVALRNAYSNWDRYPTHGTCPSGRSVKEITEGEGR